MLLTLVYGEPVGQSANWGPLPVQMQYIHYTINIYSAKYNIEGIDNYVLIM